MQQLHLVGFTTDLEGLIFSARKGAKSGGFVVALDDKLRATVEDAFRLRDGQGPGEGDDEGSAGGSGRPRRPRPESTLSPREIQARLRSGSTIAEVAREAGVDEEWVSRFAVPIQAEQAQVVGSARRLTFVKPRLGESALPLGTAVRWNLADKGIRLFDDDYEAAWTAYNLQGTSWVVRFEYASRQKRQVAEWEVDLREGELFARNRTASELGYVDAARRRRRPPSLEPSPRDASTPPRPSRDEEPAAAVVPARPSPARGRAAQAAARPASGRSTVKKTAASSKGRASTAAKKAGKATESRKAASAKKARPQKPAGKKRGRADHVAPTTPVVAPPVPDAPVRPSHLARPPSPMPTARRATTLPLHTPRPVPPRPVLVERPRRPPPPPEAEPDIEAEAHVDAPPPVVEEARRPTPKPVPPREPTPRAAGDMVRVIGPAERPERANGDGPATAPRRRPPRAVEAPTGDTPERKLARRLASSGEGGGTRPSARAAPPADEPMWHGPGSGEPAPTVRIRADLAAGTRRPETGEAAEAPPPTAARTRRRERPLRAR